MVHSDTADDIWAILDGTKDGAANIRSLLKADKFANECSGIHHSFVPRDSQIQVYCLEFSHIQTP